MFCPSRAAILPKDMKLCCLQGVLLIAKHHWGLIGLHVCLSILSLSLLAVSGSHWGSLNVVKCPHVAFELYGAWHMGFHITKESSLPYFKWSAISLEPKFTVWFCPFLFLNKPLMCLNVSAYPLTFSQLLLCFFYTDIMLHIWLRRHVLTEDKERHDPVQ